MPEVGIQSASDEINDSETVIDNEFQTTFIDLKQRLDTLEMEVGAEMIDNILEMFLEDTKGRLNKISSFAKQSDFFQLEHKAHALKGSCSNIGANAMANLCAQLEKQADNGDPANMSYLVEEIKKAFSLLESVFGTFRKEKYK